MKIGIITLPITNNYGAILQTYALQICLKRIGLQAVLIDYTPRSKSVIKRVLSLIKKKFFPSQLRKKNHFFDENITTTGIVERLSPKVIRQNKIDMVVVGSDQVWRPKYIYRIEDMYLDFLKNFSIKRIAYAASFGVDVWEYTPKQTVKCAKLARMFDAISVREESGVNLCQEHLGVDATWVLDPTLLLCKDDYCDVCKDIPVSKKKFLAAYILDKNDAVRTQCESIAAEQGFSLKFFEAGTSATLSIPEWLAMFRDASYVITDSFHGTVFSIIFGKKFKCLYNKSRGSARFDSLLKLYESGKLDEMREFSLKWLRKALKN